MVGQHEPSAGGRRCVAMLGCAALVLAACDRPEEPVGRSISVSRISEETPTPTMREAPAFSLHVIDGSKDGADGVDLGDVNGDGLLDVVSGWEKSGDAFAYVHPGVERAAERWPRAKINGGLELSGIEDAMFADLDGNGAIDSVVTATEGRRVLGIGGTQKMAVHWLTNPQDPSDSDSWRGKWLGKKRTERWMKSDSGQIDGKNGQDIVAGSKTQDDQSGELFWFEAPPSPDPGNTDKYRIHFLGDVDWVKSLELVDMDQDGDLDVLYGDRQVLAWLENPGPEKVLQRASWKKHVIETGLDYFTLCDLDGDGQQDIVAALAGSEQRYGHLARWFRRADPADPDSFVGHFVRTASSAEIPGVIGNYALKGLACGDYDRDGRTDLAISVSGEGVGMMWLAYRGASPSAPDVTWELHPVDVYRKEMKYDNLRAYDVDGDGALDLLSTEENVGGDGLGVVWFRNELPAKGFSGTWLTGAWSACVGEDCGAVRGLQSRSVTCDGVCNPLEKPTEVQECEIAAPPYQPWQVGPFGGCELSAESCPRTSGVQTREVTCAGCCNPAEKPSETQACELVAEPSIADPDGTPLPVPYPDDWETGEWGACSASQCESSGTETRTVSCAGTCCDPQARPDSTRACASGPCTCLYQVWIDQNGEKLDSLSPVGYPACLGCCASTCHGDCTGDCGKRNRDEARGACYKQTFLGGGSGGGVWIDETCATVGESLPPWGKDCGHYQVRLSGS